MNQQNKNTDITIDSKNILDPAIKSLQSGLGRDLISVVLFGSQSRGDATSTSDWDLLLIADNLPSQTFQRHLTIKRLLPVESRSLVSVLTKTRVEFESHLPDIFLDVAIDGTILFDRADYAKNRLAQIKNLLAAEGLYREKHGTNFVWRWRHFPGPGHQLTWQGVA